MKLWITALFISFLNLVAVHGVFWNPFASRSESGAQSSGVNLNPYLEQLFNTMMHFHAAAHDQPNNQDLQDLLTQAQDAYYQELDSHTMNLDMLAANSNTRQQRANRMATQHGPTSGSGSHVQLPQFPNNPSLDTYYATPASQLGTLSESGELTFPDGTPQSVIDAQCVASCLHDRVMSTIGSVDARDLNADTVLVDQIGAQQQMLDAREASGLSTRAIHDSRYGLRSSDGSTIRTQDPCRPIGSRMSLRRLELSYDQPNCPSPHVDANGKCQSGPNRGQCLLDECCYQSVFDRTVHTNPWREETGAYHCAGSCLWSGELSNHGCETACRGGHQQCCFAGRQDAEKACMHEDCKGFWFDGHTYWLRGYGRSGRLDKANYPTATSYIKPIVGGFDYWTDGNGALYCRTIEGCLFRDDPVANGCDSDCFDQNNKQCCFWNVKHAVDKCMYSDKCSGFWEDTDGVFWLRGYGATASTDPSIDTAYSTGVHYWKKKDSTRPAGLGAIKLSLSTKTTKTNPEGIGANLPVDGVVSETNLAWSSCGHYTGTVSASEAFWAIDLGSTKTISMAKLYNRNDCCHERLHDVKIWIGQDWNSWQGNTLVMSGVNVPGNSPLSINLEGKEGRYLWITRPSGPMTLCEIELWESRLWLIDVQIADSSNSFADSPYVPTVLQPPPSSAVHPDECKVSNFEIWLYCSGEKAMLYEAFSSNAPGRVISSSFLDCEQAKTSYTC